MEQLPQFDRSTSEGARRFIVRVRVPKEQPAEILSCELVCDEFRNNTSFHGRGKIDEVFTPEMSAAIKDCLSKISHSMEIISLPNFVVEMPGLTISGAHMMVSEAAYGSLSVIFRFRFFLGGIGNAFKIDLGFGEGLQSERDHLATAILAELSLPLLNLCNAAAEGLVEDSVPFDRYGRNLSVQAERIRLQVELMKRYVERSDAAKIDQILK